MLLGVKLCDKWRKWVGMEFGASVICAKSKKRTEKLSLFVCLMYGGIDVSQGTALNNGEQRRMGEIL